MVTGRGEKRMFKDTGTEKNDSENFEALSGLDMEVEEGSALRLLSDQTEPERTTAIRIITGTSEGR